MSLRRKRTTARQILQGVSLALAGFVLTGFGHTPGAYFIALLTVAVLTTVIALEVRIEMGQS